MQDFSHKEGARQDITIYRNLISPYFPKTRATFGCGVTWMDLTVGGFCFKNEATPLLTCIETGFLTKRVLVNLASGTG